MAAERTDALRQPAAGLAHVPVAAGGIIPADDVNVLKQLGVAGVYTPKNFDLNRIMSVLIGLIEKGAGNGRRNQSASDKVWRTLGIMDHIDRTILSAEGASSTILFATSSDGPGRQHEGKSIIAPSAMVNLKISKPTPFPTVSSK